MDDEPNLPPCFKWWTTTQNYGRAGGELDATEHYIRQGYGVVDLALEVDWMLSEAWHHANFGV